MSADGFKVPSLPLAGSSKRKHEDSNGTSNKRSRPTVEDESDVTPASSFKPRRTFNFAPSIPIKSSAGSVTTDVGAKAMQIDEDDVGARGDETFEADEGDEEGRFFGGGTNETQEVCMHVKRCLPLFISIVSSKSSTCLPRRKT